jgi:hypothetical protein
VIPLPLEAASGSQHNGEKPDSLLSSRQRGAGAINHVLDSERGKEHAEQT